MHALALTAMLAISSIPGLEAEDAQCRIVRIAADGGRTEIPASRPYSRPSSVTVSASSDGGASQSVAASSSTSSGGATVVRSRVNGRTIIKTYDPAGCTIVIDERPGQGGR
jgi:hypothetical protein